MNITDDDIYFVMFYELYGKLFNKYRVVICYNKQLEAFGLSVLRSSRRIYFMTINQLEEELSKPIILH